MVKRILRKIKSPHRIKFMHPRKRLMALKTPTLAMQLVVSKDNLGVYASSDTLFKGAVFGRDSIEVAEDMLYLRPRLVKKIILALASLQGQEFNNKNEEEPGKIIHEYRRSVVDGKPVKGASKRIFEHLGSVWGGNDKELRYYGSVDSTPHFIRLVGEYTLEYGEKILAAPVTLSGGQRTDLLSVIDGCLNWLVRHLDQSATGCVEYIRKNPYGIENQVWKDSKEFYVHENGELANHAKPVASIEVQAIAYDALLAGAFLVPHREKEMLKLAQKLRKNTLKTLWLPQNDYFALGIDFDEKGNKRIIKTKTANPAALLDSKFFDLLPDKEKEGYVSAIIREILGTEFLTDAGIRSRALSEARLVPFWDYHGSYSSWPKETYDIAKGMRRQGFPALAHQLENRLLNVIKAIGSYPEFIYVDARGRILGPSPAAHHHAELVVVESHNKPEKVQAWTVSAYLAISSIKIKYPWKRMAQEPWQRELEKEALRAIPLVPRFKSASQLRARYPTYPYELSQTRSHI